MNIQLATKPSMPAWESAGGRNVFSLRWQGWMDGWRGIPTLPPDGTPLATPQAAGLESAARHDFNIQMERHDQQVLALIRLRAKLTLDLEVLRAKLRDLQEVEMLARRQSMGEPDVRRAGEVTLDIEVVRRRRRKETEQELEDRQAKLNAAQVRLNAVQTELNGIPEQIESCHESYRAQLGMIDERVREFLALYWRSLMRCHPERHRLNLRFKTMPGPLETWLAERGGEA